MLTNPITKYHPFSKYKKRLKYALGLFELWTYGSNKDHLLWSFIIVDRICYVDIMVNLIN